MRRTTLALLTTALLAWTLLWLWGRSPWAPYLDHGSLQATWLFATLFVLGWVLMVTAMMLPTTTPLFGLFGRMVAERADRRRLHLLLAAGYVTVWTVFGAVALTADAGVHWLVEVVDDAGTAAAGAAEGARADAVAPLHEEVRFVTPAWGTLGHWVAPGVLLLAAAYQTTPLKLRALTLCRQPMSYLVRGWQGRPHRDAFRIGWRHGTACVACCWGLMLVMFAFGMVNVLWMVALGAVMAVEKNAPFGPRLRLPIAGALVVGAAALALLGPPTG